MIYVNDAQLKWYMGAQASKIEICVIYLIWLWSHRIMRACKKNACERKRCQNMRQQPSPTWLQQYQVPNAEIELYTRLQKAADMSSHVGTAPKDVDATRSVIGACLESQQIDIRKSCKQIAPQTQFLQGQRYRKSGLVGPCKPNALQRHRLNPEI